MDEQTKAAARRACDPHFTEMWFVGKGVDVGCGPDPLRPCETFPKITDMTHVDSQPHNGVEVVLADATFLSPIPDDTFNFLHSSHCLEHLVDPEAALVNWLRVVVPWGRVVFTIPDEEMYEGGRWPSTWNPDHKRSFTTNFRPLIPSSINIVTLCHVLPCRVERILRVTHGWDPEKKDVDQTQTGAECSIEVVLTKTANLRS